MRIQRNSRVTLEYQIGLPDGAVFEDSAEAGPMILQMGQGQILEAFEYALLGLKVGDFQSLDMEPELAYGAHDPELIGDLDIQEFAQLGTPEPGQIVFFDTETGESSPATILAVDQQQVKIDFNHPLSGQTVRFTVKILKVEAPLATDEDCGV